MASTPRSREVAAAATHAGEIADAVAVAVGEAARVDLVDERRGATTSRLVVRDAARPSTLVIPPAQRSARRSRADGVSPGDGEWSRSNAMLQENRANLRIIGTNCATVETVAERARLVRRARWTRGPPARARRAAHRRDRRSPSIWLIRRSTAARPIASIGWRTVVSGGSVQFISAESSYPTTETSRGHAEARAGAGPDRAEGEQVAGADEAGDAAVEQPGRRPPGRPRARTSRARRARRAARRRAGRRPVRGGQLARATARGRAGRAPGRCRWWPSETRWSSACSTATASSHGDPREAEVVDRPR